MEVAPSATYEAVIDVGETGLAGTIGTRVNDNTGTTTTAFSSATITEIASGVYAATGRTAPSTRGQYTLIWTRGSGGEVLGVEDLIVTASAPLAGSGDTYATVDELARILKIRTPTDEQTDAMERVLQVAAGEINSEIDLDVDTELSGWQIALAAEVNLERAAEHWKEQEIQFGLLGIGSEFGPTRLARDTWDRHAHKLAPIKSQWGLA